MDRCTCSTRSPRRSPVRWIWHSASSASTSPAEDAAVSESDREKWNARFREQRQLASPSPFLLELDGILPRRGRALDVAGGAGRHAIWLARRGLEVTLVDISDVALDIARRQAH